jgi:hypothetical protein
MRLFGFVLMHLLMSATAGFVLLIEPRQSAFAELVAFGAWCLWMAQCALLATWAVFGGAPHPWRLVVVVFLMVVPVWCLQMPQRWFLNAISLGLICLLCQAVPLWAARFLGLRLQRRDSGVSSVEPWRWQFSLGLMFQWTAAVALLPGLFRLTSDSSQWRGVRALLLLSVPLAPVTLILCRLTLGERWIAWRVAVGMGVIIGLTMIPLFFLWDLLLVVYLLMMFPFVLVCCGPFLWMSLLALRTWGYRLVWRNRDIDAAPSAAGS